MATGMHPLSDYPSKYEENHRIKYKSNDIQSPPDSSKVCVCECECEYTCVYNKYTLIHAHMCFCFDVMCLHLHANT